MCAEERANEGNPLIRYLESEFAYIRRNSSVFLFGLPERFINGQGFEIFMELLFIIDHNEQGIRIYADYDVGNTQVMERWR